MKLPHRLSSMMRRVSAAGDCFGYDMRDRDGAEPGEILVAFEPKDEYFGTVLHDALQSGANFGLRYGAGSYDEPEVSFGYTALHRLFVDPGAEDAAIEFISDLRDRAVARAPGSAGRARFAAGPNYRLRLAATRTAARPRVVSVDDYTFSPTYAAYLAMVQATPWGPGNSCRVAIVDSGLAPDSSRRGWHVAAETNLVDRSAAAHDDNGHGTAVAHIIASLLPGVTFENVKIMDAEGRGTEWSLLRGLMACGRADVINVSLDYPIHDFRCPTCRVWSPEYRSDVFEVVIRSILDHNPRTIIVAAAGNDGQPRLSYPARFSEIVAVGSTNSLGELSRHSNFGAADHTGRPHPAHYVMPGGEDRSAMREDVIRSPHLREGWGTSFAAAIASAAVAETSGRCPNLTTRDELLDELRRSASQFGIRYYSPERHGNGFIRV